jgi:hypothetical protein
VFLPQRARRHGGHDGLAANVCSLPNDAMLSTMSDRNIRVICEIRGSILTTDCADDADADTDFLRLFPFSLKT